MNQVYDLKGVKPGRRTGLTKAGYAGPSLLQSLNRNPPPKSEPIEMPPKTSVRSKPANRAGLKIKANDPTTEDLLAPPAGSSDEDDGADIKPTLFEKASEQTEENTADSSVGAGRNKAKRTINGNGARTTRGEKAKASPSSSSSSTGTKRKTEAQKDGFKPGSSNSDPFGRLLQKKPKLTYGKSSQLLGSSQSAQASKKLVLPPASPKSSNSFVIPADFDSLIKSPNTQDSPPRPIFFKPHTEESPGTPVSKFARPASLEHTPISTPGAEKSFKRPGDNDSPSQSDTKAGELFSDLENFAGTPTSTPPRELFQRAMNGFPKRDPKKLLEFKKSELGGDLASRVQDIFGQDGEDLGMDSVDLFDDDPAASTNQVARCPMCNQPCDANELKKWGTMNTRQQERFCRSHRKITAEKKWSLKGYPEIDWDKLDSRISEHRSFIKDLLNGANCPCRKTFEEMVAAGKGRSLRKMESNFTPGYYGSRGLNTISEYVIQEFSKLLSKRSVKDPLMSKRGTTAFVQSVVVPEVAVQLIMEDMYIGDVEARKVLTDSANIGELVHEEIKDVVDRIENSEDEDED